jgi:hypothetical protein
MVMSKEEENKKKINKADTKGKAGEGELSDNSVDEVAGGVGRAVHFTVKKKDKRP